ncbi:hypothetical protein EON80_30320 [bacterium]|nr:MAG: hypothetical protein EON80_30320 [bacterium]
MMKFFKYEFETLEDREMAFNNIVKWYGNTIVEKIEKFGLNIRATKDVICETGKIAEKHFGRRTTDVLSHH